VPKPKKARSLRYRKVEAFVEDYIRKNKLKAGDMIPPLTELVEILGVNGLTVRRGIKELVERNILVAQQGRGTFVSEGAARRVLWVSTVDMATGETSGADKDLFQFVEKLCHQNDLLLVPIWLMADDPYEAILQSNGGKSAIAGFFFTNSPSQHRLLTHVRKTGMPYVNLTMGRPEKTRAAFPNRDLAIGLAVDWLRRRHHRNIRVFLVGKSYRPSEIEGVNIELSEFPWINIRRSYTESLAYDLTRGLIERGELRKAVYIADDIVAKGVTRAILAHHPDPSGLDIIVQGTEEEFTPLGLPVKYMVYQPQEYARIAMDMLIAQLNGARNPTNQFCGFSLVSPEDVFSHRPSTQQLLDTIPKPPAASPEPVAADSTAS